MLIQTPPMGWNSWNTIGHNINEDVILENAEAVVITMSSLTTAGRCARATKTGISSPIRKNFHAA